MKKRAPLYSKFNTAAAGVAVLMSAAWTLQLLISRSWNEVWALEKVAQNLMDEGCHQRGPSTLSLQTAVHSVGHFKAKYGYRPWKTMAAVKNRTCRSCWKGYRYERWAMLLTYPSLLKYSWKFIVIRGQIKGTEGISGIQRAYRRW